MEIKLYYIEGISSIDTPYFATKTTQASLSEQERFFDNHEVVTLETAFYPPHYNNLIRFDIEDLGFNTNVNYLSLEYNNKRYYYFIDSVNYISESIIELEVTMDTIQTYMFDIFISSGIIDRKFINRWNNSYINRDYIRENVSNGLFIEDVKHPYITTYTRNSQYWIVVKVASFKYLDDGQTIPGTYPVSTKFNTPDGQEINSGYGYFVAPYISDAVTMTFDDGDYDPGYDLKLEMAYIFNEPGVVDVYLLPYNPVPDFISYDYRRHNIRVHANKANVVHRSNFGICLMPIDNFVHTTLGNQVWSSYRLYYDETQINIFGLNENHNLNVPFNINYVPALLDENYIRVAFGSDADTATIPLYNLLDNKLILHFNYDFESGHRIYYIEPHSMMYSSLYNNDLYSCCNDTTLINFDLINDAWQNYQANNKNRWITAGINTGVNILTSFANMAINNYTASRDINALLKDRTSYTPKRHKLKKKVAKTIRGIEGAAERENLFEGVSGASKVANGLFGQLMQDVNAYYMPSSPKQLGTIFSVFTSHLIDCYYKINKVNDIVQCGNYYHRNGYLVNEYINNVDNIFDYVFNRYYFNILKMSIPEVHLNNVIEDEDTIDSIKERLTNGLRLWCVNHDGVRMSDFQYDNTELDNLE